MTPYRYVKFLSPLYRSLRRSVRKIAYAGTAVECTCCGGRFSKWRPTQQQACPNCDVVTRQKILPKVVSEFRSNNPGPLDVLLFAPDFGTELWLSRQDGLRVKTTDLSAPGVDFHSDITAMEVKDASFDIILCSHVLEHVPADDRAMSELLRILRPGGRLFLQVPYAHDRATTDEDPTLTDPAERIHRFGQFDHVRLYGRDLLGRVVKAGFIVNELRVAELFSSTEMKDLGLWDDTIFLCDKPRH